MLGSLIVGTVLLAGVQFLAAVPWLMALSLQIRRQVKTPAFWLQGLAIASAAGALVGFLLHNQSEEKFLVNIGRLYMAILHLQIGADLFVLAFVGMLRFWPKGGAVALASFQEGLRQPKYWLLFLFTGFLMVISTIVPYFTFGEDLKMLKEMCFAFTMFAPTAFGMLAAAMSVSEEIEGRTAVTLMSKPISRRQFLLGKFIGIFLSALTMTFALGWLLVWVVLLKGWFDGANPLLADANPDPAWVIDFIGRQFGMGSIADLMRGVLFWVHDAGTALPGLILGMGQVMVMTACAVALATRLPLVANLIVCMAIYFLGHLTSIMVEVSSRGNRLVGFMANLFDTVVPGLDAFDVGSAIIRDLPLPPIEYSIYTFNVAFYAVIYSTIAMLVGLILFEDRDLA